MSLDAGADGVITVDGRISEDAASSLAADGFVRLLRDVVADRPGLDAEDPAQAADTPLDAAGAARPLTTPILRPSRDRRREGVVGTDVQVVVSAESSEEGGGALVDRVGRMVNLGVDAWSGWPVSESTSWRSSQLARTIALRLRGGGRPHVDGRTSSVDPSVLA